jgi:hypothetical protein
MRYSISPEQAKIDTQIISVRSGDLLLAQSESIDLTVKFSKSLFKAGLTLSCYQHAQQESSVAGVSSLNSDETISIKRAEKAGQEQVQSTYKSASAKLAALRKIELSNLLVKRSIESKTCWFSIQLLQEARERHVLALGLVEEKYVRQQQVLLAQKHEGLREILLQSDVAKEAAGILLISR